MTMIERVAAAIKQALKDQEGDAFNVAFEVPGGAMKLDGEFDMAPVARAALEAMKEPTPAQTAAIGAAAAQVNPHRSEDHIKSVALDGLTLYRAAIQAALDEEQR